MCVLFHLRGQSITEHGHHHVRPANMVADYHYGNATRRLCVFATWWTQQRTKQTDMIHGMKSGDSRNEHGTRAKRMRPLDAVRCTKHQGTHTSQEAATTCGVWGVSVVPARVVRWCAVGCFVRFVHSLQSFRFLRSVRGEFGCFWVFFIWRSFPQRFRYVGNLGRCRKTREEMQ